ncbi:hypothetical protein [Xanthomonas graminis]|uniref:hypothetical protein n=1 Tax=Xanthomonas graminis TaxID=3390026 RepID=UPI002543142E|nr:hypothetical protein [Xanthomonas translucens]WIH11623.1 hypothetical protein KM563_15805 [Xanthomonas translucens pv. graminis]
MPEERPPSLKNESIKICASSLTTCLHISAADALKKLAGDHADVALQGQRMSRLHWQAIEWVYAIATAKASLVCAL